MFPTSRSSSTGRWRLPSRLTSIELVSRLSFLAFKSRSTRRIPFPLLLPSIHAGRTGRAGKTGLAITFLGHEDDEVLYVSFTSPPESAVPSFQIYLFQSLLTLLTPLFPPGTTSRTRSTSPSDPSWTMSSPVILLHNRGLLPPTSTRGNGEERRSDQSWIRFINARSCASFRI